MQSHLLFGKGGVWYNRCMILPSLSGARDIAAKRVLVRIDGNVPLKKSGRGFVVADDMRLKNTLPTIRFLLKKKAKVIIATHLGRPGGKRKADLSTKPLIAAFKKLRLPVGGPISVSAAQKDSKWKNQKPGSAILLENLRFSKGEEANTAYFAKKLAALADVYVNEGFGVCHRRHASVARLPRLLPSYAGKALVVEVEALKKVLHAPKRPAVAIIGGAKARSKLPVVAGLATKVDTVLLGGTLLHSYFKAYNLKVKADRLSKNERTLLRKRIIKRPVDCVSGTANGEDVRRLEISRGMGSLIDEQEDIYDIGAETIIQYGIALEKARTIIWNGAMGMFEQHPYQYGTYALARMLGAAAHRGAFVVAGGGETIMALDHVGVLNKISHVSMGGGAMLAFLAGESLVGLEALDS